MPSGNDSLRPLGVLVAALVLAGPSRAQVINQFGVRIPMRDRVALSANIWIPASTGRFPTILIRTPYDKTPQFNRYHLINYVRAGYAVVLQDTRGRGDSDGQFDFYFSEGKDGYDTIEWIARQPWSNGRVGMDGGSYLGTVQWLAARERPPHLACIAPTAPSGRIFDEIPYLGGAFRLEWALPWLNLVAGKVSQAELNGLVRWDSLARQRPLGRLDSLMGRPMPIYQAMLAHPTLDWYWQRIQFGPGDFARIEVPSLTVTGWYDGDQPGALWYWDGMSARGDAAPPHFLIAGPWTHQMTYLGGEKKLGALTLDSISVLPIQRIRLEFFDWCLKRETPAWNAPRVRVFIEGTNRWVSADRYPVPRTESRSLFLMSGGGANSSGGDGRLVSDGPVDGPQDHYVHDPHDPVPSRDPAVDHGAIETRQDVLVYSTDTLTEPVEVLGRVFVKLWASTDAADADFTAKLLDVYPDGRAILLGSQNVGARRASYREGYQRRVPVVRGKPEEYNIELFDLGHAFLPGHRIRVEIASAAFPFIDANTGTGRPIARDTTAVVAHQTVWHDRAHPSRLLLPIPPRP